MEPQTQLMLALALLCLLPLSAHAGQQECPSFDCPIGSHLNGKFVDHDDPSDEAHTEESGILKMYYFDTSDFASEFRTIVHHPAIRGHLTNPYAACAVACQKLYNAWAKPAGATVAQYWMYEQTCDDGIGGQCMCMSPDVCAADTQWWSDEYIEGWEYGEWFNAPATYSTGKLCDGDIIGDPHFSGADGSHYEFSGIPNRAFAIISDAHMQVNAYLGGRYGRWENRIKALTWIRKIAIMWGHHVAVLTARPGGDAEYSDGYLDSVTVDGENLQVEPHGTVSAANGEFSVRWSGVRARSGWDRVDEYHVSIGESLTLRLVLRPEVKNLRTKEDAIVHFSLDVTSAHLSSEVHGVLGQTFRPDFAGRLNEQKLVYNPQIKKEVVPGDNAEGFIDGVVEDYLVKDVFKKDCRFCRFARGDDVDDETASAIALASAATTFMSRKLLETSR